VAHHRLGPAPPSCRTSGARAASCRVPLDSRLRGNDGGEKIRCCGEDGLDSRLRGKDGLGRN